MTTIASLERRLRALRHYLTTSLTWRASWILAANRDTVVAFESGFTVERRDGCLYVVPVAKR